MTQTKHNRVTITCPKELWTEAQGKTALSMSALVRILLQAVVNGELEVTIDGEVRLAK